MKKNAQEERYRRFKETGQEQIKLEIALEGFFSEESEMQQLQKTMAQQIYLEEYGGYLKRRIRPAVEMLIEADAVEKIEKLEMQGWFGKRELESFIETARRKKKTTVLAFLMQLKDKKYGYEDRDFSL